MRFIESILAVTLLFGYLILWKVKEIRQHAVTGINPKVMSKSTSNIQRFMDNYSKVLMVYSIAFVVIHSFNFQLYSLFTRFEVLNKPLFDLSGFFVGIIGLGFCLYAQLKMGASWRVGIDEDIKTELVMNGLYAYIRNPTYLGLFLLNSGIWLLWPTWTVFLFNVLFVLFLEIQVRCEEDFLVARHGDVYVEYKQKTKRYFPFIY